MPFSNQEVSMGSSQMDLVMTQLRDQKVLMQELLQDLEKDCMTRNAVCHRLFQIEGNLRRLRALI